MAAEKSKTLVKLILDTSPDIEVTVESFSMVFNQPIDAMGQVTGVPRGGQITMRVKARGLDYLFFPWMVQKDDYRDGEVQFMNPTDIMKIMKSIIFKDAICVNFIEYWEDQQNIISQDGNANDPFAHWFEITISCREIWNSLCAARFNNNWDLETEKTDNPKTD